MKKDSDEEVIDELDEETPFKYSITSYGADYPIDSLVKRLNEGDIEIPPFQRSYVWKFKQASRFIESLLLGLPVPGIFLSKEIGTQKLLVIDGQQRLKSLQFFYNGKFEPLKKLFSLSIDDSRFDGMTYEGLEEGDRRRLDDSILHATIVRQDEPTDDQSSIYKLFERLNTGGSLLTPQEIRACLYHGRFNEVLAEMNENSDWRALFGPVSTRMRDQELILRFLALHRNHHEYRNPMKEFLNTFMANNRNPPESFVSDAKQVFADTVAFVRKWIGEDAFKPSKLVQAALFDSVMVAVANRLLEKPILRPERLRNAYKSLLENERFRVAIETRTSDEERVNTRLELATKTLGEIE